MLQKMTTNDDKKRLIINNTLQCNFHDMCIIINNIRTK